LAPPTYCEACATPDASSGAQSDAPDTQAGSPAAQRDRSYLRLMRQALSCLNGRGEFYLKRANDAMRVPSLILNLIWLAFTRLSPFIEGERIEVRGRRRMLIGKNYPSPSLLSLLRARRPRRFHHISSTAKLIPTNSTRDTMRLNCTVVRALNRLRVKNVKNLQNFTKDFPIQRYNPFSESRGLALLCIANLFMVTFLRR
jgi:hypothetical protein